MQTNYPNRFGRVIAEYRFEDIDLSDAQRQVVCILTVRCGEDEEQVYQQEFSSLDNLEADGLRKAGRAVDNWQTKELDYLIDQATSESEE